MRMYFDCEKRIVYQKSMKFMALVATLLSRLQSPLGMALLFPVVEMLQK